MKLLRRGLIVPNRRQSVVVAVLVSLALTRVSAGGRIHEAARAGDDRGVQWALSRGARVDEPGPRGATALISAFRMAR